MRDASERDASGGDGHLETIDIQYFTILWEVLAEVLVNSLRYNHPSNIVSRSIDPLKDALNIQTEQCFERCLWKR